MTKKIKLKHLFKIDTFFLKLTMDLFSYNFLFPSNFTQFDFININVSEAIVTIPISIIEYNIYVCVYTDINTEEHICFYVKF